MGKGTDKVGVFLTGILVGGVIGGAVAALFTPYSGKKMRRVINRKKDEVVDEFSEIFEVSREKAEELYEETKNRAETLIKDAKKLKSS